MANVPGNWDRITNFSVDILEDKDIIEKMTLGMNNMTPKNILHFELPFSLIRNAKTNDMSTL